MIIECGPLHDRQDIGVFAPVTGMYQVASFHEAFKNIFPKEGAVLSIIRHDSYTVSRTLLPSSFISHRDVLRRGRLRSCNVEIEINRSSPGRMLKPKLSRVDLSWSVPQLGFHSQYGVCFRVQRDRSSECRISRQSDLRFSQDFIGPKRATMDCRCSPRALCP